MSFSPAHVPSYRLHSPSGQGVVTLNGKDLYLGPYKSPESVARYEREIAQWLVSGRQLLRPANVSFTSVNDVILAYFTWALHHYRDEDGKLSREPEAMRLAFRPLKHLFGETLAAEFGPLKLQAVRQYMIGQNLVRSLINKRTRYIQRMFEWAVSQEMIPPTVREGVLSVKPLMAGRGGVREGKIVTAVPDAHVDAILPFLPPTLQTMVRVQRLTGMRSGELVRMTMRQIERGEADWVYRPTRHKTSYRGYDRAIPLGPSCREALKAFLKLDPDAPLFNPQHAQEERNELKRQKRKSKVQPSQLSRAKARPKKQPGLWYDPRSYHMALRYAMKLAMKTGLLKREEFWHPHQLRHAAAQRVQHAYGLDGARAFAGHHTWAVTAHYAKRDLQTAIDIAARIG